MKQDYHHTLLSSQLYYPIILTNLLMFHIYDHIFVCFKFVGNG